MPHETDPLHRFTSRADDYVRFRPGYPDALFECLRAQTGMTPSWPVADVGSGTGIFTRALLSSGNRVYGVEPNAAMRKAAREYLHDCDAFVDVDGRADATTLPDTSVQLVTVAQAFHWLDPEPTRREFARILREPGWVAVVWNTRCTNANGFMRAYEQLLVEDGVDYTGVDHRNARARIGEFLGPHSAHTFEHTQELTLEVVTGRMLSASYVPGPEHPGRAGMVHRLGEIFAAHGSGGRISFVYEAELYLGKILEGAPDNG